MTLLFFDGFDNAALIPKSEWDTTSAWVSVAGRDASTNGGAGLSVTSSVKVLTLPTAAATCVLGLSVMPKVAALFGTTGGTLIGLRTGALTTDSVVLNFDAQGRVLLRTGSGGGTILATGTTPLPQNAWTHLQIKVTSSSTALAASVFLNGSATAELTYSGAAASSQTAAITKIALGQAGAGSNAMAFDDLYVCDTVDATATQGRPFNDVLGDLKVTTLLPTGVGASTDWTPSTGTSNVALVGENPPNQTDYVSATTTGLRDTYDTADLPTATTTVYALRAGAYAQKSDAGAANLKPLVRESGGTLNGATTVALGTGWGPAYGNLLTRKGDSSLWTVADVNAAQVGIESA